MSGSEAPSGGGDERVHVVRPVRFRAQEGVCGGEETNVPKHQGKQGVWGKRVRFPGLNARKRNGPPLTEPCVSRRASCFCSTPISAAPRACGLKSPVVP